MKILIFETLERREIDVCQFKIRQTRRSYEKDSEFLIDDLRTV